MINCTVIIIVIMCGAYLITDVQTMQCSIDGTLRRVRRFFRKEPPQQTNVPQSTAEELKRFNDECQNLTVVQKPPPKGFNIDQPASRDSARGHTSVVVRVVFGGAKKKPYAVKRISMPWIAGEKGTNAYRDICTEMKILQDVEHPFIVKLLWSLYNEKYAVMIFDYLEMGPFINLIQSAGPMSEEKVKFYSTQLVLVVEYLHDKNIVHRDIKGENILVDNEGYLKVTDFGTSVVDDGKLIDDLVGTITYAAPEVLTAGKFRSTIFSQPYLRKPTDVWSLGVVIYTMLFGKFPYDCDDIDSMFNLMQRNEVHLPEHVYMKVEKIGKRDPEDRLTIKQIKDHDSWNTPSGWIKSGSNPPKFDWDALQRQKFRAPLRPSKNFQKYIDTESGYEFDKIEVSSRNA